MPSPTRNTARINANVYTVAPKCSDSNRVQTTSDASAVIPDIAMTTYTVDVPRAIAGRVATASAVYVDRPATANAITATATLIATAVTVATFTSCTRSR